MFDFERLRHMGHRVLVHCPDRDTAVAFVREYREKYQDKYFKGYPGDDEYWHKYRENTCYIPNLCYDDSIKYVNYMDYKGRDYVILIADDLKQHIDLGPFNPCQVDIKCLFGME